MHKSRPTLFAVAFGLLLLITIVPLAPPRFHLEEHEPVVPFSGNTVAKVASLMNWYFQVLEANGAFIVRDAVYEVRGGAGLGSDGELVGLPIGSLTKQFTGYLIAYTIDSGLLAYDTKVSAIITELSDTAIGDLIVWDLSTHRSGLAHSTSPQYLFGSMRNLAI